MKKIKILFICILSMFSINSFSQVTAKDYGNGVITIPEYFSTYMTVSDLKKIYDDEVSLNNLIKQTKSPLPWIVYSDRSKNIYKDEPNGFRSGTLEIGEPLLVYNVSGNWIEVGKIPERVDRKYIHNKLGWMEADQLILSPYAVIDSMGGPKKGMILTSVNAFDKTSDVMKILENNQYLNSPNLNDKFEDDDRIAKKFQFLFILKETNCCYLLSKTDNLSKQVGKSKTNIRGWLPKAKVTKWNHRVCLEPSSEPDVVEAYEGKTIYVIDSESHYRTYLEQGSLPNKDWAIREIELTNRRPFAYQMRMPILPDWDGEDKYNKKVACIAQMYVNNKEDKPGGGEIKKQGPDELLAKLQTDLLKNKNKLSNVNILFVLDGTISMKKYGPAVSRSISEFITSRESKYDESNYKFALAIYRNYADENETPELFEFISFTSNVNRIKEKLENNVVFDSKNKSTHDEAHYYGMINAIKRAKFDPKETNVLVLVGDAGNIQDDTKGLNKDKVVDLLYKKNINLISFQVNYVDKTPYKTFNSDVYYYQKKLGINHANVTSFYSGVTFKKIQEKENTYNLEFKIKDNQNSDQKEMYPIFGKLKFAKMGSSMDISDFETNLVSSLDEYSNKLTEVINYIEAAIDAELKRKNPNTPKEEEEDKLVFTKGFEDYLIRLGYSPKEISMLKRQGEISAQGFLSTKSEGTDLEAFTPVIFISKEYKDKLADILEDIAAAKNKKGSEARRVMYNAIIAVMKSIVGEEVSIETIEKLTFNDVWIQILGVPYSGNSRIKNLKIYELETELDDEEFIDFYTGFAQDVERFKRWDATDVYSRWIKAGQTYYWIPLDQVPGCSN